MMRCGWWMAAAVLVAVSAVPASAQRPAPRDWAEHGRSPMTFILEHRAELELSDAQVARLEAIGEELRARTAPLRERMREAMADMPVPAARARRSAGGERAPGQERVAPRAMTPEQREARRARMRELRPVREEVRAIQRAARDEARAVLTADQQDRLRELIREGRDRIRRRDGEPRPRRRIGRA